MSTTQANDFLVSHAYKNVWSTPDPLRQAIYRSARLTPFGGNWRTIEIFWNELPLPTATDFYHVYQLGHYHNTLSELYTDYRSKWLDLNSVCESSNLIVVVYNDNGIQVPRHLCKIYITEDGMVLLAVLIPENDVIEGLDLEADVFVRFYTNNSMTGVNAQLNGKPTVQAGGSRPMSRPEIVAIQNHLTQVASGYPAGDFTFTVNGRYVDVINTITVSPGDYVDWMYCASIVDRIDFKISTLGLFRSEIDNVVKLLASHAEDVSVIEHHDDMDIYLVTKSQTSTTGVLIHKSADSAVRMVTHRDYSISDRVVTAILNANDIARGDAYLRFVYHKNLRTRPLVFENNRIHELYKLPFADRYAIMLGTMDAPVFWTAARLEASKYIQIMSAKSGTITRSMVADAYGYNSLSTILGATPSKVKTVNGALCVDIPPGLQMVCSGYEFDDEGKLLAVGVARNTTNYNCVSDQAKWVELIFGEADLSADYIVAAKSGSYSESYNYRFYHRSDSGWNDITGSDKYTARNGVWTLANNVDPNNVIVVSNAKHIFGSTTAAVDAGVLSFEITTRINRVDVPLVIPCGQLDVYLNGHPLVEGVDYYVQWPQVVVTSKEYIDYSGDGLQSLSWRCYSFCDPKTMKHSAPGDVGVVVGGRLSGNARYDIHDDRVLSIICAGSMYDRSEVVFAETTSQVSIPDAKEGYPYAIKDIIVPMNNYLVATGAPNDSTTSMISKSRVYDQYVSNFMTLNYPQVQLGIQELGTRRYHIYSPFFSRIISDLSTGYLSDPSIAAGSYTEAQMRRILEQYVPLLDLDPINAASQKTKECIYIDPHCYNTVIALSSAQKNFLDDVVDLYGQELIDLRGFVAVI